MNINIVLIIVLLLLACMAVHGYQKGLVKKVISLLGLIVAFIAISLIASAIDNYASNQFISSILAIIFLVILILALQISKIITGSLKLLTKIPVIHGVNKLAGLVLGIVEGLVFVWTAFMLITIFHFGGLEAIVMGYVEQNGFLQFLYRNNYLVKIISGSVL